jgi:hypothetical protein
MPCYNRFFTLQVVKFKLTNLRKIFFTHLHTKKEDRDLVIEKKFIAFLKLIY